MKAESSDSRYRPGPPPLQSDWALFLDVDGCLLEHAATPGQARAPAALGRRLCAIAQQLDGALALVSGRSIAALDQLFPDCGAVCIAGLHGLERRSGTARADAPAPPPALARLGREAQAMAERYPGICIELHGPCLNLHWRGAPQAATPLAAFADAALPRLPGYAAHHGAHGIEIRPTAADKGAAIRRFLDEPPFRGRRPVFAGDDVADERGFAVVNARRGISVLVGERDDSAARHALPDPGAVRRWLGVPAEARA
ncbi:trehalose-phosphatase [Lysobacter firmicutimachus]|uniref:Trehalose 6-phosphate phosphatase n=1 Tax=Lysobacter firmicutimachus TaxID=1792846 RepID=A0AAU8MPF2_9GAMM